MNELALFAGAGGGILGGKLLGWRTTCAVERDGYAASVLAQRQNDQILEPFPIWSDVTTFDARAWKGNIDVVSGGFPCQDISAAGRGEGIEGARSGLWKEMGRIIHDSEPLYVFVENSPMLTHRGLGVVLGDLAEMGFDAEWGVLGADDIGAPHIRKRIWILARRHGSKYFWNPWTRKLEKVADSMPSGERGKPREEEAQGDALADSAHYGSPDQCFPAFELASALASVRRGRPAPDSDGSGLEGSLFGGEPEEEETQSPPGCGEEAPISDSENDGSGRGSELAEGGEEAGSVANADLRDGAQLGIESGSHGARIETEGRSTKQFSHCGSIEELADADSERQPGPWERWFAFDPAEKGDWETDRAFAERIRGVWGIESPLGRVANGVAHRMDRLKAIGNGQVASVAELAFRILNERLKR